MRKVTEILNEAIFDSQNQLEKGVRKTAIQEWATPYLTPGSKLIVNNKAIRVNGSIRIKNFTEESFPDICFTEVTENVYIEDCPNILSIEGLFDTKAEVNNLYIENCKSLNGLNGLPISINGDLSVSICPNLRTIASDSKSVIGGDIYFYRCGRKIKEQEIKNQFLVHGMINCSVMDESEIISEAFQSPIIKNIADQLDKDSKQTIFNRIGIQWDKLPSSAVQVYKPSDPVALKAANSAVLRSDGSLIFLFSGNKLRNWINTNRRYKNDLYVNLIPMTQRPQLLSPRELGRFISGYDKMIIIRFGDQYEDYSTLDITQQRNKNNIDVVKMGDREYDKQLANRNNARREKDIKQKQALSSIYKDLNPCMDTYIETLNLLIKCAEKIKSDPEISTNIDQNIDFGILNNLSGDFLELVSHLKEVFDEMDVDNYYSYRTRFLERIVEKIHQLTKDLKRTQQEINKAGF